MGEGAILERSRTRVLVWDEAAGPKSIAPLVSAWITAADVVVADDARDLLARVLVSCPDVVMVAVHAADGPGPATIERLHRAEPSVPILAVGTKGDPAAMIRAMQAGARGFAILDHSAGAAAATPTLNGAGPLFHRRPPATLSVTERELQILRGMTDGRSNLEIARELFVSEDTVKTHARRLFRKLGANDRAHAVALGMRYELVA